MTLKRTFACVLSYVASQMLASGEAEAARRIACAEKPLAFLLSRCRVGLTRVGIIIRNRFIVLIVVQVHVHVHVYGAGTRLLTIPSFSRLVAMMLCSTSLGTLTRL
jgi:hypothetical protein